MLVVKMMIRRAFTWLLILLFTCMTVLSVFAEESTSSLPDSADAPQKADSSGESDFSDTYDLNDIVDYTYRFGANAVVETDSEGYPVTVNGYPFRMVDTCFNIRSVDEKISGVSDFLDYPFWQSATVYNGNLAVMSMFMSLCAARDLKRNEVPETFDPSQNVELYLESAGFRDIRKDDYSKTTSIYTISTAMGYRTMEHEGEDPFTLIAVGVCGGGYGNEWQSNLAAGSEELHEGFRSASDLVIDRICGYIATRGIKGRIKIWISGFSRAAAVANLTAGRLTRAGAFPKDDVFCYTYATPAAVLNPPESGNENIFNILCPTDAVPQVMPVDWGYGRYGKDLYLPVPEFDTFGETAVVEREQLIKDMFDIEIHYSASLNLRMRMLISMAYSAIGTRDNYVQNIQNGTIKILQEKNASSTLATMRNMLNSIKGSDRKSREKFDILINYLIRVFGNAITRTELAAVNRNSGSALFLLFTEHREDAYLASYSTILNNRFELDDTFTYVMVRGPVDVEITIDGLPGWKMVLPEKGSLVMYDEESGEIDENPPYPPYYMERIGTTTIAAIPQDVPLRVTWKANSDGAVEVRQAECGFRVTQQFSGASSGEIRALNGDKGTAWSPEQRDGSLPEGFTHQTYLASDVTRFLGISAPFVSWRVLIALILLGVGILVFLIISLSSLLVPNRTKKKALIWFLLALFCIASVETEGAFWLLADMPLIRLVWKAIAAAAVLAIFFLRLDTREKLSAGVFPGLLVLLAAYLLTELAFVPGMVLFLIGHVLLILSFLLKKKLSVGQWIQWAILSVLAFALIFFVFFPRLGVNSWTAVAFAPVIFLMFYTVSSQPRHIRHAANTLIVSDLLLGIYLSFWSDPIVHIFSTILFSVSLIFMTPHHSRE